MQTMLFPSTVSWMVLVQPMVPVSQQTFLLKLRFWYQALKIAVVILQSKVPVDL